MMWLFAAAIVVAMGAVAMVAAGYGRPLAQDAGDPTVSGLPEDRPLGAEDLRRARFSVGLRGYRMSEVDALLARLATERESLEGGQWSDRPDTDPPA